MIWFDHIGQFGYYSEQQMQIAVARNEMEITFEFNPIFFWF